MKLVSQLFRLLFVATIGVLGAATFVEQAQGPSFAAAHIYHTWWFFLLWAALAAVSVAAIWQHKLWQRTAVMMLHGSLLVILVGAATTFLTAREGRLHLRKGVPARQFVLDGGQATEALPFREMVLDSFRVVCYPGTAAPQDFVSQVSCHRADGTILRATISMNHILQAGGYRFYQSSFDPDMEGTVLSVNYDPWGTPVTYSGYALFALSAILVLCGRRETFRRLLRSPLLRKGAVATLLLGAMGAPSPAGARSVPTIQADRAARLARMPVIYNDRVAPLSTLAHDFTIKLYGKSSYKGLTAEQVVYGWMKRPDAWKDEPMLLVKDGALRQRLGISGKYARLADLFDRNGQYRLQPLIEQGQDSKAVRELDEKVGIILMLTNGSLVKPATGMAVSDQHISAEILYNNIPFAKWLAMGNLALGTLMFLVLLAPGRTWHRWMYVAGLPLACLSFAATVFCFGLRWYISGQVPLGNGYETMLFMALCVMAVALVLCRRFAVAVPFGFLLSGFTLLVAFLGEMNPQITPLMPVLQSPLLSAHVSVIMMAYALLAFTMICGIAGLLQHRFRHAPQVERLTLLSRLMLYPAVFLLAAGIFLGAVWANVSWGRYWSWDPKEVWALITMLVYAVPLHRSAFWRTDTPVRYHAYMVAAFLTVLMTYFGVNYFLGGMHGYA